MSSKARGKTTDKTSGKSPNSVLDFPEEKRHEELDKEVADELRTMQYEALERDRKKEEKALYKDINAVFREKSKSEQTEEEKINNLIHCIKRNFSLRGNGILKTADCEDDGKCRRSPGFNGNCIPKNKKFNPKSNDNVIEKAKMRYFNYLIKQLKDTKTLKIMQFSELFDKFNDIPTHDELKRAIKEVKNKRIPTPEIGQQTITINPSIDDPSWPEQKERMKAEREEKKRMEYEQRMKEKDERRNMRVEDKNVQGGKKKTRRKTITKRKRRKTHRKLKKH